MALKDLFAKKDSDRDRKADREAMAKAASLRAQEGTFPIAVTVANNEVRRYRFISRLLAAVAVAEAGAIITLGAAIMYLTPLKTVEPYLLQTFDRSEQIVRIEPVSKTIAGLDIVSEQQAREYVAFRHTIMRDVAELRRRWDVDGFMGQHTADREYARFREEVSRSLDQIIQNQVTREVIVNRSTLLQSGLAQVEFTVIDRDAADREFGRQVLVADISYEHRRREVRFDQRFLNPTGFTVTRYQLSLKTQ